MRGKVAHMILPVTWAWTPKEGKAALGTREKVSGILGDPFMEGPSTPAMDNDRGVSRPRSGEGETPHPRWQRQCIQRF